MAEELIRVENIKNITREAHFRLTSRGASLRHVVDDVSFTSYGETLGLSVKAAVVNQRLKLILRLMNLIRQDIL